MSPAGQPNGSPRRRKITRPTPIEPTLQTELDALGSTVAAKKKRDFDPQAFLATISEGRKFVLFPRKQSIFAQGDTADAVFYIQTGKVKLTVVSKTGKEATIGILSDGDFFGEGGLAGQLLRMSSASAMTDCAVLRIDKQAMMEALHREHEYFLGQSSEARLRRIDHRQTLIQFGETFIGGAALRFEPLADPSADGIKTLRHESGEIRMTRAEIFAHAAHAAGEFGLRLHQGGEILGQFGLAFGRGRRIAPAPARH